MTVWGRRLIACAVAGLVLVSTPANGEFGIAVVVALAAATLLLDLFDLWLPHGDSVSVDGALAATAIVLTGPLVALGVSVVGRAVAALFRRDVRGFAVALERRLVGLTAGALAGWWAGPANAGLGQVFAAIVTAAILLVAELMYAQIVAASGLESSLLQLFAGNVRLQGPILLAQISVCGLAVMTYQQMSVWSLVMAVVLLLLIRQSYESLLDVRSAYQSTVELLIDAAEGVADSRRGHAERTARIARHIGRQLGVGASQLERISYAALLHDVDLIGSDDGSDRREGRHAGRVLKDIEFLTSVAPVLSICDGDNDAAWRDEDLRDAFIVALSSDIDMHQRGEPSVTVGRVARMVPAKTRGKIVGVAVGLGYPVPAIDSDA